jgi:hypothetical protein
MAALSPVVTQDMPQFESTDRVLGPGPVDGDEGLGLVAFACHSGCTLGDDHSKLGVAGGLPFGHVTFDNIDVRGMVQAGRSSPRTSP